MKKHIPKRHKYSPELLINITSVQEFHPHKNPYVMSCYAIMLLEKASGIYQLDMEPIQLVDHSILFIRPNQINQTDQIALEKGTCLILQGDFLDTFFHDKNFLYQFGYFFTQNHMPFLPLEAHLFHKYHTILTEINTELQTHTQDSPQIIKSLLHYLLLRLNQLYGRTYDRLQVALADSKTRAFLHLLASEIHNMHTVQSFAHTLDISRTHLNKLCQKHFGKTSQQIIRKVLLKEIKKAIRFSQKDLSEIAYMFHFSAPSHFSRFFKQMTSLSPQAYRRSLSKNSSQ